MEELNSSDMELPLFTSEAFQEEARHLYFLTTQQWMSLEHGRFDNETADVLANMCHGIINQACSIVLSHVEPQVHSWMCSMEGETLQMEQHHCRVTPEDFQASMGNSLHSLLQEIMEAPHEASDIYEGLLELVAEEVSKKVNYKLAIITWQSTFIPELLKSVEIETSYHRTKQMVHLLCEILRGCLKKHESSEEVYSVSTSSQETDASYVSEDEDCRTASIQSSQSSDLPSIKEEVLQRQGTFLAEFLSQLLDRIIEFTNMSVLDLDFEGMLKSLRRTMGEVDCTFPQTCGTLHHTIFKNIRKEFGSKQLLKTAVKSDHLVFVEAVARELKTQLQDTTCKSPSFLTKVRGLFGRKSEKVTPACEVDTSASHSEVVELENGSPPVPQEKQKRPAIIRMFSAVARTVRRPFRSCLSV